ncbi:MAG: hypothetical protein HYY03_09080 [Chloroflexi bacterium]|nr:hypothetical protein [Chloroflexota bacterium]
MPRGGRRPGAGAKPGNLNALKHGLRSRQFAQLGMLLASIPQARQALLDLARRHQLKQRRAEEVAALLLSRIVERGVQIRGAHPEPVEGSNAQSPIDDRRTINQNTRRTPARRRASPAKSENIDPQRSDPEPDPPPTIENQIRKPP